MVRRINKNQAGQEIGIGSKIGSIGGYPQLKGRTTWGTCAQMHMHREQREKVEILCERIPGPHVCTRAF